MMLSLLLLLLALSSASPQDIVKKPSEDRHVTSLNQDQEDKIPEMTDISVNTSVYQQLLFPRRTKQKRQTFENNSTVKWQTWTGSLPDEAVGAYNYFAHRFDYVCKYGCEVGFYSRSLGDFCHYLYAGKEQRTGSFDILVNENDFEILNWKEGSNGSVSEYAVRTCSSDEFYVGKNEYGLGKVHPSQGEFYFLLRGTEQRSSSYEVLTINRDIDYELISHVTYKTNEAKIIRYLPSIIRGEPIYNRGCNPVTKTVTMSKTVFDIKRWDLGALPLFSARRTFQAGIPNIVNGAIQVGTIERIMNFSEVPTEKEAVNHTAKAQVSIPPYSACFLKMLDDSYDVNIPFTALLSRIYRTFRIKKLHISGTYHLSQTAEVRAVLGVCTYPRSAEPCP